MIWRPKGLVVNAVLAALAVSPAWAETASALVERWRDAYRESPHVYEAQTLIASGQRGMTSVLTMDTYSRMLDGKRQFLWRIATPPSAKGMRLSATRDGDGRTVSGARDGDFLFGSVFTMIDLIDPLPQGWALESGETRFLDRAAHYVIVMRPGQGRVERRAYLRKDDLWLSRVEVIDPSSGTVLRRVVYKSPQPDDHGILRAQMLVLDDMQRGERSLLKIERRVNSPDYVPDAVFTSAEREDER